MGMKRRAMFTKKQRSAIMSRIRSRHTKLDLAMESILREARIPFVMYPKIPGNPDFLVGKRAAVFCDSSFWHGRRWERLRAQLKRGSNSSYWVTHIARNRTRDRRVNSRLRKLGYSVLRFWDDQVLKRPQECVNRIRAALES